MRKSPAVITVFFSLLSIVFLSLSFAFLEAVRYRAARAHCADLTAVGNWSVFSEFENRLLERFDLFGIDGSSGDGRLSVEQLGMRLKSYLDENASVRGTISDKLPGWLTFDPFRVTAEAAEISEYALLSDRGGEYFYRQAVDFMHKTAWMNALGELSESARSVESAQKTLDEYRAAKDSANRQIARIRGRTGQTDASSGSSSDPQSSGEIVSGGTAPDTVSGEAEASRIKNPLWKMITLSFRNVLSLVCEKGTVSEKKLSGKNLLSKRKKQTGNLKLDTGRGGLTDNLLFREYLLDHFPDRMSRHKKDESLDYQIEYILSGTASDSGNLRKTADRLVLLREAYNYLYLQKDPEALRKTQALSALLLGWTGNAALIEALRELFVIYWAYGESLYDVRILMQGGRIPLMKTPSDWHVPLEQLYDLERLLKRAGRSTGRGEDYSDYLRLLLNMQSVSVQQKRSLDLLELDLRKEPGMKSFRADCCVIAVRDSCVWRIHPVFSSVPEIFLGTGFSGGSVRMEGGFAYR